MKYFFRLTIATFAFFSITNSFADDGGSNCRPTNVIKNGTYVNSELKPHSYTVYVQGNEISMTYDHVPQPYVYHCEGLKCHVTDGDREILVANDESFAMCGGTSCYRWTLEK